MSRTIADVGSPAVAIRPDLLRTARITGVAYLGLAVTGLLGFLLIRNQLFVADDPRGTLSNLIERETLARAGVALELGVVLTQTVAAVWFYRLFRSVDTFAAGLIAVFGMVNAAAILGSAAALATALDVAGDSSLAIAGDAATTVQLLYVGSGQLWGVGELFFGLWLIPMGWLVVRSRWMPQLLGWLLMAGGLGYVLSAFVQYLAPDVGLVTELITVPASIGEFWILGYLIIFGVRQHVPTAD